MSSVLFQNEQEVNDNSNWSEWATISVVFSIGLVAVLGAHLYDRSFELMEVAVDNFYVGGGWTFNIINASVIFLAAVAILMLVSGTMAHELAKLKGHSCTTWLYVGMLFGPLGVLGAIGLPDLHLRHELDRR